MKIKDLNPHIGLGGIRFRYPGDGQLYYWHSQWQKGVWGKKDLKSEQVFPLCCDDLKESLEWEVVPDEPPKPNVAPREITNLHGPGDYFLDGTAHRFRNPPEPIIDPEIIDAADKLREWSKE